MRKVVCIRTVRNYNVDILVEEGNFYYAEYHSYTHAYDRYREWNITNMEDKLIHIIDREYFNEYFTFLDEFRDKRINEILNG